MVPETANTENLCSLIMASYENALFYQPSYFEIIFMSDIITLIPEQLDLLTETFRFPEPAPRHSAKVPAEPCAPGVGICSSPVVCSGWPCPKTPSCSEPSPAHSPARSFAPASGQPEALQGRGGSRAHTDPGCEASAVFIPAWFFSQLTSH